MRQVAETLAIIVAEGDRLTGLIDDLLDLAKIESGRFEWHLEPLRLADVVRQALDASDALFEAAGLDRDLSVADGVPEVVGDRGAAGPGRAQPRVQRRQVHALGDGASSP